MATEVLHSSLPWTTSTHWTDSAESGEFLPKS